MDKREWQPLTIPRVAWNQKTITDTFGELVAEPLDPGSGMTFGNALRRVLLGSVEGSAVTSIIIKGVNNEFAALSGVIEDTMQVALNIKGIVIKNETGKPGKMHMHIEGEKVARVADITADEHLKLMNPEHIIAHVATDGVLDIQFFVESGRGYVVAKWPAGEALQKDERMYLDAMFSPIKRVTFDVKKTRIGGDIDYDQLHVTIVTNGAEKPLAALQYAVSVLRTQLEHFLTDVEIPFNEISSAPYDVATAQQGAQESYASNVSTDLLLKPIDALEFSVRANNCLLKAGIKRIVDLVNLTEDEALNIKHFGRKSFEEVKEGMRAFGLSFGMNISEENLKKAARTNKKEL
jgi:DNA-directed RNA polymerase subunit alpha